MDAAGWPQYLKSGTSGSPTSLQNMSYTYDTAGNVSGLTSTVVSETHTYGYDALDRLTSWTLNNGTPETYSYDAAGNLDVKAGVELNYNDASHVHAVTHLGSTQKYWYDADGNQITRVVGADTYTLLYDAENRLVEVKKNNLSMATFVYDGDGSRVKSTINGTTTYFAGAHFEVTGSTATKYYFAGAQRVAMRSGSTLYYLLADHLGSTSLTTNTSGAPVAEMRYKPCPLRSASGVLR